MTPHGYPLVAGFVHLGAGLACGFTGLTAGYAIGIVGDSVRFYHLGFPLLTILPAVRPRICTRVQSVRRYGSHTHLRRSLGPLWVCVLVHRLLGTLTRS